MKEEEEVRVFWMNRLCCFQPESKKELCTLRDLVESLKTIHLGDPMKYVPFQFRD